VAAGATPRVATEDGCARAVPDARDGRTDVAAEADMTCVMQVITAARTIRSEHEVHPGAKVPLRLRTSDTARRELLSREARFIASLVKTDGDPVIEAPGARPPGSVISVACDVDVLVGLKGLVAGTKEAERIDRTVKKIEKDLGVLEKRLSSETFLANAPPDVVAQAREQRPRSSVSLRGCWKSAGSSTSSDSGRVGRASPPLAARLAGAHSLKSDLQVSRSDMDSAAITHSRARSCLSRDSRLFRLGGPRREPVSCRPCRQTPGARRGAPAPRTARGQLRPTGVRESHAAQRISAAEKPRIYRSFYTHERREVWRELALRPGAIGKKCEERPASGHRGRERRADTSAPSAKDPDAPAPIVAADPSTGPKDPETSPLTADTGRT